MTRLQEDPIFTDADLKSRRQSWLIFLGVVFAIILFFGGVL